VAAPDTSAPAWRVRVPETDRFDDWRWPASAKPGEAVGDFVVRRVEGWCAYQLAVVIDDAYQRISEVVRGIDLLDSTPRQIHLQRLLGLSTPHYLHLPHVLDTDGHKLSKQDRARPVDHDPAPLRSALGFGLDKALRGVPPNCSALLGVALRVSMSPACRRRPRPTPGSPRRVVWWRCTRARDKR
jgi:glutamyl-Q tRNA(Asp) synthetase